MTVRNLSLIYSEKEMENQTSLSQYKLPLHGLQEIMGEVVKESAEYTICLLPHSLPQVRENPLYIFAIEWDIISQTLPRFILAQYDVDCKRLLTRKER